MRVAPFPSLSDLRERATPRAVALTLVIAVHLLLLLMLLRLAPPFQPTPPPAARTVLLDLPPEKKVTTDRSKAEKAKSQSSKPSPKPRSFIAPKPVVALPPSLSSADADAIWAKVTPLSRQELAETDTALSKGRDATRSADAGGGAGRAGASAAVVGSGPDGQPMYAADWYKRPTNAELAPYLPPGAPRVGWGMIACQTVEGYRVDNCSTIGQSPAGSGFANAVLQAAWQFRVLPPRIGGRPQIGTWVRIRIDYTEREAR